MKKFFLFIICLGLLHVLKAQTENALLWRITHPESADTSYLYGSMHTTDQRAFFLIDTVEQLIGQCEVVAGEIEQDFDMTDILSFANLMVMQDSSLVDFYTEAQYELVQEKLQNHFGPQAFALERIKPIYLSLMIGELAVMEPTNADSSEVNNNQQINDFLNEILDGHIQSYGKSLGLEVVGLESPEEVFTNLDRIPLKEQAKMLFEELMKQELSSGSENQEMETLMELYCNQDLEGMSQLVSSSKMDQELEYLLIDMRNEYFTTRFIDLMVDRPTFCTVGAMHLIGETGMIQELQNNGYTVEPLSHERK